MKGMKVVLMFSASVVWGADLAVEVAAPQPAAAEPPAPATPETHELKWDSGNRGISLYWYTGAGSWVGNDFDISTIATYNTIRYIRMFTTGSYGMRYGIFGFGAIPGSLLWGPYFYRPTTGSGWRWVDVPVNWTLPPATRKFVAAAEQYYNYPYCDGFALDNNPTFMWHSWQYYQGAWSPMEGYPSYPYRNLMLRVVVAADNADVAPMSFGRVKALYR